MEQPDIEQENMGVNESVFEKRQSPLKQDPNQNRPLQPKPNQYDDYQRYLEELAGKSTAAMGDTLGMMGGQEGMRGSVNEEAENFDLPPEKQKYSQSTAGQGVQFPVEVSPPPDIASKGSEPEQRAHKEKYSVERHSPKSSGDYKALYSEKEPGQGVQQPRDIGQSPEISNKRVDEEQTSYKESYTVSKEPEAPTNAWEVLTLDDLQIKPDEMPIPQEGMQPVSEPEQATEQLDQDAELALRKEAGLPVGTTPLQSDMNASDDLGLSAEASDVLSSTSNFELSDSEIPRTRRVEQNDPEYITQDLPDLGADDSENDLGTRAAGTKNAFVHFMPTEPETADEAAEPHVDRGDLQPDENVSHPEDFLTPQENPEEIGMAQIGKEGTPPGDLHIPSAEEELGLSDDVNDVLSSPSHFESEESHTRRQEQTDPSYTTMDLPDLGADDSENDLGTRAAGTKNAFVHFMPTDPETADEAAEPHVDRGDLQPDENVSHPEDFLTPQEHPEEIGRAQIGKEGKPPANLHIPSAEEELGLPDDAEESHTRRKEQTDPSYATTDLPDLGPDDSENDLGTRPVGTKKAFIHFLPKTEEQAAEAAEPVSRSDIQPDENVNRPEDLSTPQERGQKSERGNLSESSQGPGVIGQMEVNMVTNIGESQTPQQFPIREPKQTSKHVEKLGRSQVTFASEKKAIEYHHIENELPESERCNLHPTPVSGFPLTEMELKAGKIKHAKPHFVRRSALQEQLLLGVRTGLPKLEIIERTIELADLLPFTDTIRSSVYLAEDTYDFIKDASPAPVRWGIRAAESVAKTWIRSSSLLIRPFQLPIHLLDRLVCEGINIISMYLPTTA